MSAKELRRQMELGGVVIVRWKYRLSAAMKPKRQTILKRLDGSQVAFQRSALDALIKAGVVGCIEVQRGGDRLVYDLLPKLDL